MDNICVLISQKRKERGLTQSELGAMLGISGKAVSKWERGLSKPCDEHLEKLIDLLGLPVESTITAEEKKSAQKADLSQIQDTPPKIRDRRSRTPRTRKSEWTQS